MACSERRGQQFIVGQPAGATPLSDEAVVRDPPDGTYASSGPEVERVNAALYDKLNSILSRLGDGGGIARTPLTMAVIMRFRLTPCPNASVC